MIQISGKTISQTFNEACRKWPEKIFLCSPSSSESNLIELGDVHTISWQIKVKDIGENSSYSMLVMDEFNCERFKEGNSISSLNSVDMWSKSNLEASEAINPKRDLREKYCAVMFSDVNSESSMELTYKVNAQ